jgi:hypothetical protein
MACHSQLIRNGLEPEEADDPENELVDYFSEGDDVANVVTTVSPSRAGAEEANDFTGWMWISAFSILAFGGAGVIFMITREMCKSCR